MYYLASPELDEHSESMRLLINAVGLRAGGGLTVGLNCLRGIREARPAYELRAFVPAHHGYEDLCRELSISYQACDVGPLYPAWRLWFDQVQVPLAAWKWSADVLFAMNNQPAWTAPCPQLVLFHNPYYIYPSADWPRQLSPTERASLLLQRRLFAASAPRCAYVAAQTTVAARRLRDQFGIDPARLAVVASAVAPEHHGDAPGGGELIAARMRQAAGGRIGVLTLARYYPHKDLEFVLRVARRLRELGDRRFVFFITVAADQHPGARALLQAIEQQGLSAEVVNIGPVAYDQLRETYQAARVCFLPTVLESLSGTYLEALQYRLPIITTDRDFAHATCGSSASYFPPGDVEVAIELLRAATTAAPRDQLLATAPAPRPWLEVGREVAALIDAIPKLPMSRPRPAFDRLES